MRLLALSPLLLAAWLILVTVSDRYAELHYRDELGLGGDLSASSALLEAAADTASGNDEAAERKARAALRLEPLSQEALRMLAQMNRARGDEAGAERYFLTAAQLGWREGITQVYWFERAMKSGDYATAARRIEALLRTRWNDDYSLKLFLELEATAGGRAALADRLQVDADWAKLAQVRTLTQQQLENRFQLLALLQARRTSLDRQDIGTLAREAFDAGRPREARRFWVRFATPSAERENLLSDGGFEAENEPNASPFAWRFDPSPGINASIEAAPSPFRGRALRITSDTTSAGPVLRQSLALPPGSYRLSWKQQGSDIALTPRIVCSKGKLIRATIEAQQRGASGYRFDVPGEAGCASQTLHFSARAKNAAREEMWLDDVLIQTMN